MENMKEIYGKLEVSEDVLAQMVVERLDFDEEYARLVAYGIVDDLAKDIAETADPDGWSSGDVSLAVGRVLAKRLGMSV